jgi:hypothetical protein
MKSWNSDSRSATLSGSGGCFSSFPAATGCVWSCRPALASPFVVGAGDDADGAVCGRLETFPVPGDLGEAIFADWAGSSGMLFCGATLCCGGGGEKLCEKPAAKLDNSESELAAFGAAGA